LKVTDCSGAPADATLPFLDVTLRNTRAMETVSQILGDAYARDLSAALHSACDGTDYRTPTTTP
ncbi:MAG: Tat pathway signal sequence domain protein, partial [Kitasatospora sp.]|nr:Tat pathway signal sequence domain protein [Kitasatospora sp.]